MNVLKIKPQIALLIISLTMSQYIGIGFFSESLATILREQGMGLEKIGFVYFIGLFLVFRFLWSPFVELGVAKLGGIYKNFILILQILMVIALFCTSFFDIKSQLSIIILFGAIISFLSATQSIATGALIIKISNEGNLSYANSLIIIGNSIGHILGVGLTLVIYDKFSWTASVNFLLLLILFSILQLLFFKENARELEIGKNKISFKDIITFIKKNKIWMSIIVFQGVGICTSFGIINPILVDLGWSLEDIGYVVHMYGLLGTILGGVLMATLINKIGAKNSFILIMAMQCVGILTMLLLLNGFNTTLPVLLVCCLAYALYAAQAVVVSTIMMKKSTNSPANELALQTSINILFQYIYFMLGFMIASKIGYKNVIITSSIICLIVFFYLLKMKKHY